jgi:hypothetical protein
MITASASRVTITAITRSGAEEKLNASVQELQRLAEESPTRGILVTKLAPGHFTVDLSDEVPYGLTWETTWQPGRLG